MPDLKHREAKMQQDRKNTPRREFVKEICSWYPLNFYRNAGYISRFPVSNRIQVTNMEDFENNRNESIEKLSHTESFLKDLSALGKNVNLPNTFFFGNNVNTLFSDLSINSKNVYLSSGAVNSENIFYSFCIKNGCSNIYNSVAVSDHSDNVYQSCDITNSSNVFYSNFIKNSFGIYLSSNLINCQHCIDCQGLENKSYCIKNEELGKDLYEQEKKKRLSQKNFLGNYVRNLGTKGDNLHCSNITGASLKNCDNITNGYFSYNLTDSRNIMLIQGDENEKMFDTFFSGTTQNNDFYGVAGGGLGSEHVYNSANIFGSHIYYSYYLESCSYCLGCIGLKNKQFCILNKQYTKEERFAKANEIFAQMEKDGQLGKFFPPSINPFYFNDTVAYLIDDSFTKEEVEAEGYLRRDEEIKVDIPDNVETVYTSKDGNIEISKDGEAKTLDDFEGFDENGNWKIDPDIMKKVIIDEKGNAYKIVKMEYDFLIKHGLPLPRLHWLDRIKLGFQFK